MLKQKQIAPAKAKAYVLNDGEVSTICNCLVMRHSNLKNLKHMSPVMKEELARVESALDVFRLDGEDVSELMEGLFPNDEEIFHTFSK